VVPLASVSPFEESAEPDPDAEPGVPEDSEDLLVDSEDPEDLEATSLLS
jgi:hypothetical protein